MNDEPTNTQSQGDITPDELRILGTDPQGTGENTDVSVETPAVAPLQASARNIPTLSAEAEADGRINPHANPSPDQLVNNIPPPVQGN